MRLCDELGQYGIEMDGAEFKELLSEIKDQMYPDWSDERLTWNPTDAIRYCAVARFRCRPKSMEVPDEFFLRWLINTRKHGI